MRLNEMPLDDAIHLKKMLRKDDSWRFPQVLSDAYDYHYDIYVANGQVGPMGPDRLATVIERAERISGVSMKDDVADMSGSINVRAGLGKQNGSDETAIGPKTTQKFKSGDPVTAKFDGKSWEGEYVKSWGGEKALVRLKGMEGVKWNQIPLADIAHRSGAAA